jgi:hypothetical protein
MLAVIILVARVFILGLVTFGSLLLSGCSAQQSPRAISPKSDIQSVYTGLNVESCKKEADKTDPNETPYLVCPGAAGYSVIVRRVDAGRKSIDVVDTARRAFPLNYQEFVTRHMFTLDDKAEWRVASREGTQAPLALISRVRAQEDNDNPEKVTRTYIAVAKITPAETCVTDVVPEGSKSDAEVRSLADSAPERRCAAPQPPMTGDGTVIR